MNSKLAQQFDALETQRNKLIARVKRVPEKFNIKPDSASWSIHQVLAHLIAAEKLSVQYLSKKLQGIDAAGDTGVWEEMKMIALKISQRLPLKFKAPQRVVESTPTYESLDALAEDWSKTRSMLRAELEKIQDHQLKKKIYKHVIAGKLNIIHAIDFLEEHINHHMRQLNRLLR